LATGIALIVARFFYVGTYLDEILVQHRERVANDARSVDTWVEKITSADETNGKPRGFVDAICRADGLGVISEVKRRSPSKGDLDADLDPAAMAIKYVEGDTTCLSVLTDENFFGGSAMDLQAARSAVSVPVLRKDFTVGPLDVVDARLMGADAVLLIVAALDQVELRDFFDLASELGLDCLLETHDEAEVERAMDVGPTMIGVNQRDLKTFEVDTTRALRVGASLDPSLVRVAESGVKTPDDAARLAEGGYDAVLVGESIVTSGDATKAVAQLREAGK